MNTRHELAILSLKATAERCIKIAAACNLAIRGETPVSAVKGHIDEVVAGMPQLKRDVDAAKRNFNLALEDGGR